MVDETRISELDPASSEDGTIQTIVIQESSDGQGLDNFRAELYSVETIDRLEQESIERDSQLDQRINETNADLLLEAEARWQADVLLGLAIEDEANERIQADELLQQNIDTETQARIDADTALDLRIDGVIDDVGDVSQALAQEIQDRIEGDNSLGLRIDSVESDLSDEVQARIDGDDALESSKVNKSGDLMAGDLDLENGVGLVGTRTSGSRENLVRLGDDDTINIGGEGSRLYAGGTFDSSLRVKNQSGLLSESGVGDVRLIKAGGTNDAPTVDVGSTAYDTVIMGEGNPRVKRAGDASGVTYEIWHEANLDPATSDDLDTVVERVTQNESDISDLQTGKEDSIAYGPSGYMALVNEDGDGFQFVTPPDFSFFRLRGIMTEYTGPDDTIIAEITGDSLNDFLYKDTAPNVAVETPNGFAYRAQENFSAEITDGGGVINITIGDFLFWNSDVDQWLHLPTATVEGGVESINNLAGVINFQAGTGLDIVVNAIDNTVTFLIDDTVATDSDIQALQSQITSNADQIIQILEDLVYVTGKLVELEGSIDDNATAISELTARVAQNESNIETLIEDFSAHIDNLNNPHEVTAAQVGAATTGALAAHTGDTDNPHGVTAAQVGAATTGALNAHVSDETNPHAVTASQVGAAPASHVTDETNPHNVTAEQVGAVSEEELQAHIDDNTNPHAVTAAQTGAAPASHVTDEANPHAVTAAQVGAATTGALAAHVGNTGNPHSVTADQIGSGTFSTGVLLPGSQVSGTVGTATNQSGGSVNATTGSFSGAVTVQEPTEANHPATKGYVDGYEAFPIGAAYSSVTSENPSTALGYGTWVQLPSPTAPVVLFEGVAVLSIDEEEITWFEDLNDHGGVDAFTHITFGFGRVNTTTSPVSVYTEIHNMVQGVQSNPNTIILYGSDGWDDFRVCNAQLSSAGVLFAYAYEDGRNISTPTVRRIIGHKKVYNVWERTG